ncbi:MAG: adenylate/guanylate cyclase domain-containing protein [Spirochaetia bacterium]|nr:adenylate/guanylate cyclase domain-containing protein [Spirochaetia bacterium]
MKLDRKVIWGTIFGILPMFVVLPLHLRGGLHSIEDSLIDLRYRYFNPAHEHSKDVVIVDIDERTLNAYKNERLLGRWPWRRDVYQPILQYIADGGPRIILFDIMFTERSEEDAKLATATRYVSEVVPLSHAIQLRKEEGEPSEPLPATIASKSVPVKYSDFTPRQYNVIQYPAGEIMQDDKKEKIKNRALLHSVTYLPDSDGISRMAEPIFKYGDSSFLLLPVSAYLATIDPDARISISKNELRIEGFRSGKPEQLTVPLEDGLWRIHYYPKWVYDVTAQDSIHRISVSGIIDSIRSLEASGETESGLSVKVPKDAFTDKIVIFGASAAATYDEKLTPQGPMPGFALNATMVSNLLGKHFLIHGSPVWGFILSAVLLAITAFFSLYFHRMVIRVLVPGVLFVLCMTGALFAFRLDYAFYLAPVPLTFIPAYLGALGVLTYFEGAEKRRFKGAMAKYLSPDVLEEVMNRGEIKAEVGERRIMTVLFSDVRGFTTISENMDAAAVVSILNEYFSHMVRIIFEQKGTLDKFIGDAIMAFWGAPIHRPDHALLAVRSALAMTSALRSLNQEFAARQMAPLAMGVGVNTGEMIVGNIGSDQRLDYTLIGDNVNLGSRLESLTTQYGAEILIAESTKREVEHEIPCRIIDLVAVKGKSIPISVYEPLDHAYGTLSAKEACDAFAQAFELYRNRNWDQAISIYENLNQERSGGGLQELQHKT